MNIIEFKNQLITKNLTDEMIIFKYIDNTFLIHTYIDEISNIKNLTIHYIQSLDELNYINPLLEEKSLYVYITDKLTLNINYENLIIICKDIDKDIINYMRDHIIEMPKLENWQIKDYVASQLPGLESSKIEWLCNITHYDIYKLYNEILKLNIFTGKLQETIFKNLNVENNYKGLSSFTIFDLVNCIVKRDTDVLKLILLDELEIEPFGLISILEKNFINILSVQTNPNTAPDKLNLNYNQFKAIQYNCNKYTDIELMKILEFLTSLDFKIKSGRLNQKHLLNLILINILGV